MKILAFLQNQYFDNPDKVKQQLARQTTDALREKLRRHIIHYALFAGCLTGRRLKAVFGQALCDQIIWEESSREIGGKSSSNFPPDPKHMADVIVAEQPEIVLTFGHNALKGLMAAMPLIGQSAFSTRFQVISGPHPAARTGTPTALAAMKRNLDDINLPSARVNPLVWHHCYDEGWKGYITPESFAHPAKMARGLLTRIVTHMLRNGWIKPGDVLGEPFGGVGTTGLIGAYHGLRVISNELEPKFVALARANYALHAGKWRTLGLPEPVIHQGDSRRFDVIVDGIVTSPPFTMGAAGGGGINVKGYKGVHGEDAGVGKRTYQGTANDRSENNIERLKAGAVDSVITSPPYATIAAGAGGLNHLPAKEGQQGGRAKGPSQDTDQRYGKTEGQIAGCREGSVDAVVTSPPWEDNSAGARSKKKFKDEKAVLNCNRGHGASDAAVLAQSERDAQKTYGDSAGQIGVTKGRVETCLTCDKRLSSGIWQNVKIAELLSLAEVAGVSDTTVSTSEGKASRKPKSIKQKLQHPIQTSRVSATEKTIPIGMEEVLGGEVTLGASSVERHLNGINSNAASAHQDTTSLSITSKTKSKPEACGITVSEIFKRFAEAATPRNTPVCHQSNLMLCAKCAEILTSQGQTGTVLVLKIAARLSTQQSIIGGSPKKEPENYWQAMKLVYQACYRSIKPGGYMAVVVKDYVKAKKRVPLCDDTLRLLQHVGFEPVERIHAMLVHEKTEDGLFGEITVTKTHKSFFRRVAESKGSPAIDWECVLIVRKPL